MGEANSLSTEHSDVIIGDTWKELKSLRILFAETEAILNSRPLTVQTLDDVKSEQPLSPNNILTMKTKVVMPPPGEFVRADEFSRRCWRRVQHIANEFWQR